MSYNYYDAVVSDIYHFLNENYTFDQIKPMNEEEVVDIVYNEDEVTGCANGYDYPEVVADYVRDNLEFALRCADEYGITLKDLMKSENIYLTLDNLIRSYILYECANEALLRLKGDRE